MGRRELTPIHLFCHLSTKMPRCLHFWPERRSLIRGSVAQCCDRNNREMRFSWHLHASLSGSKGNQEVPGTLIGGGEVGIKTWPVQPGIPKAPGVARPCLSPALVGQFESKKTLHGSLWFSHGFSRTTWS